MNLRQTIAASVNKNFYFTAKKTVKLETNGLIRAGSHIIRDTVASAKAINITGNVEQPDDFPVSFPTTEGLNLETAFDA